MGRIFDKERKSVRLGLRFTVALGVFFPTIVIFTVLSIRSFFEEREVLEEQAEQTGELIGEIMSSSLSHAMLAHDFNMIEDIVYDLSENERFEDIQRMRLVNMNHELLIDSSGEIAASRQALDVLDDDECAFCHLVPAKERDRSQRITTSPDQMRIAMPLRNNAVCRECHTTDSPILGVFLIDMSMESFDEHIRFDLREDLLGAIMSVVLISVFVYVAVTILVIRRIEAFRQPISEFAQGNFSVRLGKSRILHDEICDLADATNDMVDQLEAYVRRETTLAEWKEQTLTKERERISHELHDGLAQILGYIKNKTKAARLMIVKLNLDKADQHLSQLESATHEISLDVREAIIGLRMSSRVGQGLEITLNELISEFMKRSNILVETSFSPEIGSLELENEKEYQILRVTQEALTNIRKHARSDAAFVKVDIAENCLRITVSDQGQGFIPSQDPRRMNGFGLRTMRERVETIDGDLSIESAAGQGTIIQINVPINLRKK